MQFTMTPAAEKSVRRMLRFTGGPGSGFRLAVSAGGCSGLSAQFEVEAGPRSGDAVVDRGDIRFFLPAESRLLLDGVTIDFVETPTQSGLVFYDPKTANCGCKTTQNPAAAGHAHSMTH